MSSQHRDTDELVAALQELKDVLAKKLEPLVAAIDRFIYTIGRAMERAMSPIYGTRQEGSGAMTDQEVIAKLEEELTTLRAEREAARENIEKYGHLVKDELGPRANPMLEVRDRLTREINGLESMVYNVRARGTAHDEMVHMTMRVMNVSVGPNRDEYTYSLTGCRASLELVTKKRLAVGANVRVLLDDHFAQEDQ